MLQGWFYFRKYRTTDPLAVKALASSLFPSSPVLLVLIIRDHRLDSFFCVIPSRKRLSAVSFKTLALLLINPFDHLISGCLSMGCLL